MVEGDRRIGITTTVPVEVIFAAGLVPVDLNNIFISDPDPLGLVSEAEEAGLPRTTCAWIKGIYSACLRSSIRRVVGVVQGDCSSTKALLELLENSDVRTVDFAYPIRRDPKEMLASPEDLAASLGTTLSAAEEVRGALREPRGLLAELQELVHDGRISGAEAHGWMVSSSDFRGDWPGYTRDLEVFLSEARRREAGNEGLRVMLAGVPVIVKGLFDVLAELGVSIVENEVPGEFCLSPWRNMSLQEIYSRYSYPYDSGYRLHRLRERIAASSPRGVVHYQQSFCHRQITALLLKDGLPVPVLGLECDRPGTLDGAARTRLEGFVEMLRSV